MDLMGKRSALCCCATSSAVRLMKVLPMQVDLAKDVIDPIIMPGVVLSHARAAQGLASRRSISSIQATMHPAVPAHPWSLQQIDVGYKVPVQYVQ